MKKLERAYQAALAAAAQSNDKVYIRFGKIPRRTSGVNESYRIAIHARTGHLPPAREKGVSVFPTYFSKVLKRYVILETHGWVASLGELWAEFLDEQTTANLLSGKIVGEGSDGEPLLQAKSIKVLGKLTAEDIWVDGGINRWSGEEATLPPELSQAERATLRDAIYAEARKMF